jgi:hypothetical protein
MRTGGVLDDAIWIVRLHSALARGCHRKLGLRQIAKDAGNLVDFACHHISPLAFGTIPVG